jgi:hypothetical protein
MAKKATKKKLDLLPGMVFAIPFFKGGGWGTALLMRHWDDPRGIGDAFTCGFDGVSEQCPTNYEPHAITLDQGINFAFGSDVWLRDGTCPLLGVLPSFSLHTWPVPPLANAHPHRIRLPLKYGIGVTVQDEVTGGDPHFYAPMPGPIALEDFLRLPPRMGLGDTAALAAGLKVAVTLRHPYQYHQPFEGRFEVWSRVMRIILTEKPELRKSAWVWSELLSLPV